MLSLLLETEVEKDFPFLIHNRNISADTERKIAETQRVGGKGWKFHFFP